MTVSYLNGLTDLLAKVDHEIDVAIEDRDMNRADALMGDADKLTTRIENQRKATGGGAMTPRPNTGAVIALFTIVAIYAALAACIYWGGQ